MHLQWRRYSTLELLTSPTIAGLLSRSIMPVNAVSGLLDSLVLDSFVKALMPCVYWVTECPLGFGEKSARVAFWAQSVPTKIAPFFKFEGIQKFTAADYSERCTASLGRTGDVRTLPCERTPSALGKVTSSKAPMKKVCISPFPLTAIKPLE